MKSIRDEGGQTLVFVALGVTVLVAFMGLAIDVVLLSRSRRNLQIAADAAAIAPQYFEMFGNRGIYNKGWTAVTRHSTRRQLGTLRHQQGLEPGERPGAADARKAPRTAAPVAD